MKSSIHFHSQKKKPIFNCPLSLSLLMALCFFPINWVSLLFLFLALIFNLTSFLIPRSESLFLQKIPESEGLWIAYHGLPMGQSRDVDFIFSINCSLFGDFLFDDIYWGWFCDYIVTGLKGMCMITWWKMVRVILQRSSGVRLISPSILCLLLVIFP